MNPKKDFQIRGLSKLILFSFILLQFSCTNVESSAFAVKNIKSVSDGISYIENMDRELRLEFDRVCRLKNNDSKKEEGLIVSGKMSLFYYGFWAEGLESLSYEEQSELKKYCQKIREKLPNCMITLMDDSKFCNECWTIKN